MLSIENHPPADPNDNSFKGVDLSNPSLDDHNSIPKFSIRDYVFNARSKDIKTNWPFSQKNLQLCLEHGVKDILPPFQCLDCVKNRPSERDGVESSSSEKGNTMNSDVERVNKVGSIDPIGYKSCDKQLPVTINNPSPLKVFPKTSEKPKIHFPKKPETSKPPSVKKCRLTLKVGPRGVEPNSNVNTFPTMVEPIASSKVCPVCKKFSSSSNTTLNAHIDQCLSMDSPIEPSSKSTVIKHRIKPRKTRLMVDIYATAPHCTMEELDRRNGRIWSEKQILPTIQEDKAVDCGEEKKQRDGFDEKSDDGAVYIDANGTKLRILNKISDTSSVSKLGVMNPRRLGKTSKGDISTYKKKKKHSKYLKLASQREKTCAYKTRLASRVLGDQGKDMILEESPRKDENMDGNITQIAKSREQVINSGTILPKWGSSKGTDLLKRRFESDQSSLGDSYLERSYSPKGKQVDNSSGEGSVDNIHEQITSKRPMGFKSFGTQSISSSSAQILSVDKSSSSQPKSSKVIMFSAKNGNNYNENHLDHQRGIDEDGHQVPIKRSTVLKIKKKKSQAIISQMNEPTQDCGNGENPPSPKVNSHFEDQFVNMEPHHGTKTIIGQSSGAETFDQHFYSINDTDMETEPGPTDTLGNYFSGVDPITIPGPPGSFLPSPGRSSSNEDNHGNSSLTTSQVQSSGDHLEIVERDSSNSPKSANSTVLNSLIARSDLKATENLSSVPQDDIIKLGFSDEITKSTLGFQDGQPCCCSRKEGDLVNCQESQLLRRRGMPSFLDPTVEKPQDNKIHVKPSGDFGSPSPSSPNPVLRLMGKNLIVVNNDENINQSPTSKFHSGPLDNQFHEFKPGFAGLNRSINNPFSPLRYNKNERVETLSEEPSEVHTDGMNVIRTSSGGFPIPLSGYYNSGNLNPFYRYQGTEFSTYGGPHMIPYASTQTCPPSSGPMRWNNIVLEGSNMLPQSSFSPSTNPARSSFYYSPGMS